MSLPVAFYEISQKATFGYSSLFMVMEAQCHKAGKNVSQKYFLEAFLHFG